MEQFVLLRVSTIRGSIVQYRRLMIGFFIFSFVRQLERWLKDSTADVAPLHSPPISPHQLHQHQHKSLKWTGSLEDGVQFLKTRIKASRFSLFLFVCPSLSPSLPPSLSLSLPPSLPPLPPFRTFPSLPHTTYVYRFQNKVDSMFLQQMTNTTNTKLSF